VHEKMNVEALGAPGAGGEYLPQAGFGWSNGALLVFLSKFNWGAVDADEEAGEAEGAER